MAVCLLPEWMIAGVHLQHLPGRFGNVVRRSYVAFRASRTEHFIYFGSTSLLIVIEVAMDTVQQIKAHLVMRNYEGFINKGELREQDKPPCGRLSSFLQFCGDRLPPSPGLRG